MTFDLQRVLLSMAIMAVVTYIIRVLPLAILKRKYKTGLSDPFWPTCPMRYWRP